MMFRQVITNASIALALAPVAASAQLLMMPDSNYNRLVLFDAQDGTVVNANYFALAAGTPIHAMQVGQEIWVSEQVGDRISRWDLFGAPLGAITGGLDNIRGMEQIGSIVYVTNFGTANDAPGNAVVKFDTAGNNLGFFSTVGLAPSPFGILEHQGAMLVSSSSANDDIHRFTLAGASLGTFHNSTSINFAEQMSYRANGNVLVAGFSPPAGIYELDVNTGAIVSSFTASGARGVWQLGNGNILWTSSFGAFVYDVNSGISTQIYSGGGRYIDRLAILGACCLWSGECEYTTEQDCYETWMGPGSTCDTCWPAEGACCYWGGGCDYVPEWMCSGNWLGPGSSCWNCQSFEFGACCYPDGSCTYTNAWSCSGTWMGPYSFCDLCPQWGAACCLADGTCQVLTETDCTQAGGTFGGPGTSCTPNPCPQPGACCHTDGTCSLALQTSCSGTWLGVGTTCSPANPCPPAGACCLATGACQTLIASACALSAGLYLGDNIPCGRCAGVTDLDPNQTVTLNPGGGGSDPTLETLVTITNTSGQQNATVTVGEILGTPPQGGDAYAVFGRTVRIETSLPNGQFFMIVQVPFAQVDLPFGTDPLAVNLTYRDAGSNAWMLAVSANTQDSPGHAGRIGDRFAVEGTTAPTLSDDLGDYGVFWSPTLQRGFVWANVDHATDFAPGAPALCPGDLDCDGDVDFFDIDPFVAKLGCPALGAVCNAGCPWQNGDVDNDGDVDFFDIDPFVSRLGAICP